MATKKSSGKKSASREAVAAPPTATSINDATRLIQSAVERALKQKQLPTPKIRGPIFLGIWYNPVTKQLEVINQFE